MRIVFSLLIFIKSILAFDSYYYSFGKKVEISLKESRDSKNLKFRDREKYITEYILLKPKNKNALNEILNLKELTFDDRVGDIYRFRAEDSKKAIDISNRLYEQNLTLFSNPDFITEFQTKSITDPLFLTNSWHLEPVNQKDAYHLSKGEGVKVAVYDTGVEIEHPDLKDNYLYGFNFDDIDYNTEPKTRTGIKPDYHGTAVSSILLASENGEGLVGVAPKANLVVIKNKYARDYLIIKAFAYALEESVDIVNCSWGTYDVSESVAEAIDDFVLNARDKKGGFVVFAVGNAGADESVWGRDESTLESVIAVGSVNRDSKRSAFSNYGEAIDLVASGGEFDSSDYSTMQGVSSADLLGDDGLNSNDYVLDSESMIIGTSFSAPIVSGVIANILSVNNSLTKDEVTDILYGTAQKVGDEAYSQKGSYTHNRYYGYGLIDSKGAIERSYDMPYRLDLNIGWNFVANISNYAIYDLKNIFAYRDDWVENPEFLRAQEGFWIRSDKEQSLNFKNTSLLKDFDIDSKWKIFGAVKNLRLDKSKYITTIYRDGEYLIDADIIYKGEAFWAKLRVK